LLLMTCTSCVTFYLLYSAYCIWLIYFCLTLFLWNSTAYTNLLILAIVLTLTDISFIDFSFPHLLFNAIRVSCLIMSKTAKP